MTGGVGACEDVINPQREKCTKNLASKVTLVTMHYWVSYGQKTKYWELMLLAAKFIIFSHALKAGKKVSVEIKAGEASPRAGKTSPPAGKV